MKTAPASGPGEIDAVLHLLDRQILDPEGRMVAKVDDLELTRGDDGTYTVTALLVGPAALGPRLGGAIGRLVNAVHARLSHRDQPDRIPVERVTDIGSAVTVDRDAEAFYGAGFESWARTRIITKLPGARHDPS
jgi:sporulation protein YlmC with PRC-barrel domain